MLQFVLRGTAKKKANGGGDQETIANIYVHFLKNKQKPFEVLGMANPPKYTKKGEFVKTLAHTWSAKTSLLPLRSYQVNILFNIKGKEIKQVPTL